MTATSTYLQKYYKTANQLSKACSISPDDLAILVNESLVPKPSYIVTKNGHLISQAFGTFSCADLLPKQYFHPGNSVWVRLGMDAKKRLGAIQGKIELEDNFKREFINTLVELNKTLFRLPDSFSEKGEVIKEGIDIRADQAWNAFLNGIFSLCVADPSTIESIARKEILQEAITAMSDDGEKVAFQVEEKADLLELISQYSAASMPFSPLEYSLSSRKRLIDDLKKKLLLAG